MGVGYNSGIVRLICVYLRISYRDGNFVSVTSRDNVSPLGKVKNVTFSKNVVQSLNDYFLNNKII